jgi:membrane protein YdbS with pleckstrin-like domain
MMIMEKTIWKGRASWFSMLTLGNVILALFTGGLWLIIPAIRILSTEYTVTEERMITIKGILSKSEDQVEWVRLKDISSSQGILGRICGYGNLEIHTGDASKRIHRLNGIPDPGRIKEEIRRAAQEIKTKRGVRLQEEY